MISVVLFWLHDCYCRLQSDAKCNLYCISVGYILGVQMGYKYLMKIFIKYFVNLFFDNKKNFFCIRILFLYFYSIILLTTIFYQSYQESINMSKQKYIALSEREKTIIKLVSQAKCRKDIASELKLSVHTVDTHLRHIHLKTHTHSLLELIVWQMRQR